MQMGKNENENRRMTGTRKPHRAGMSQLLARENARPMRETVVYQWYLSTKRKAAIINPKQAQVIQVRIQATKRKYVNKWDRRALEVALKRSMKKKITPRTPFGTMHHVIHLQPTYN